MIARERPVYPQEARRAGWEGTVVVALVIGPDGQVREAVVQAGSGHAVLDDAAVAAVRKWRFSPATHAGQPVTVRHRLRIRFKLDEP